VLRAFQLLQALVGVLVLSIVVFILVRRALGRARGRRTPRTGNVLEVMDEAFSPARHVAALELQAREHRGPVTPTPDDWLPAHPDDRVVYVRRRGVTRKVVISRDGEAGPTHSPPSGSSDQHT
jgi:hypothetical protein